MLSKAKVVRHPHTGTPSVLHTLLEPRALLEMALLPASLPLLMQAPRGDGHPVLLLPGFMAGEATLIALKLFLQSKGYDVHTWGLGRNMGFRSKHANALPAENSLPAPHHRAQGQPGWLELGRRVFDLWCPKHAGVCALHHHTGQPRQRGRGGSSVSPHLEGLYRLVSHRLGTSMPT
jgi:hypothetical protein